MEKISLSDQIKYMEKLPHSVEVASIIDTIKSVAARTNKDPEDCYIVTMAPATYKKFIEFQHYKFQEK